MARTELSRYAYKPFEDELNRLREELFHVRSAVIGLAPSKFRQLLTSHYQCTNRRETYQWLGRVAEQVVDAATILPREAGSFFEARAYCPLCGGDTTSPYDKGFSVPEGLLRHLTGFGNVHMCPVTDAAQALAREYWNRKFAEAEKQQELAEAAELKERRSKETLYRVAPGSDPELVDEGQIFKGPVRAREEFEWAERRLLDLGFKRLEADRVCEYIDTRNGFTVYADPRWSGSIAFAAYKTSEPKRRSKRSSFLGTYAIRDSWKHGLNEKYERWVNSISNKKI